MSENHIITSILLDVLNDFFSSDNRGQYGSTYKNKNNMFE